MEACSLHPFHPDAVRRYVESLPRLGQLGGNPKDRELNAITYGLARFLSTEQPVFFHEGISLSTLEARIDRAIGMLMRPPSRLFIDAGLDPELARRLPIRLDLGAGRMGGAFIPARLISEFAGQLDAKLERMARRLADAEMDATTALALLADAARYAGERGLGLYEAVDVGAADAPESFPEGAAVVIADRRRVDPMLRKRIEAALKPAKRPGLLTRAFGRGARSEPESRRPPER
ncbi:MAG: hypothetical protein ACR2OO_11985 [Thermomicrobiales bacterium]